MTTLAQPPKGFRIRESGQIAPPKGFTLRNSPKKLDPVTPLPPIGLDWLKHGFTDAGGVQPAQPMSWGQVGSQVGTMAGDVGRGGAATLARLPETAVQAKAALEGATSSVVRHGLSAVTGVDIPPQVSQTDQLAELAHQGTQAIVGQGGPLGPPTDRSTGPYQFGQTAAGFGLAIGGTALGGPAGGAATFGLLGAGSRGEYVDRLKKTHTEMSDGAANELASLGSTGEMVVNAALGAIPFGKLSEMAGGEGQAVELLKRAAINAIFGAGSTEAEIQTEKVLGINDAQSNHDRRLEGWLTALVGGEVAHQALRPFVGGTPAPIENVAAKETNAIAALDAMDRQIQLARPETSNVPPVAPTPPAGFELRTGQKTADATARQSESIATSRSELPTAHAAQQTPAVQESAATDVAPKASVDIRVAPSPDSTPSTTGEKPQIKLGEPSRILRIGFESSKHKDLREYIKELGLQPKSQKRSDMIDLLSRVSASDLATAGNAIHARSFAKLNEPIGLDKPLSYRELRSKAESLGLDKKGSAKVLGERIAAAEQARQSQPEPPRVETVPAAKERPSETRSRVDQGEVSASKNLTTTHKPGDTVTIKYGGKKTAVEVLSADPDELLIKLPDGMKMAVDPADVLNAPPDPVVKSKKRARKGTAPIIQGVADDVVGGIVGAARKIAKSHDDIKSVFIPASRGQEAKSTALTIRAETGLAARKYEQAVESTREFSKQIMRLPESKRMDFIDRIESGTPQGDPSLQRAANTLRQMLDDARGQVQALGTNKLQHFIENYFPHIWEDSTKAGNWLARIFGKRPLEGPKSFLKKRTIPTTAEGLKQGLKPITDNPVELTLLKLREMNRYVMAHRIIQQMKADGLARFVRATRTPPEGWIKIDDRIATVFGGVDAEGALRIRGYYYAPEPAAKVINNYLSPGLRGKTIYDAYQGLANLMNQAQLGISAFHLGFTSMDAMVSKGALGIRQLAASKPIKAIQSFVSLPIAPISNYIRGSKVLRAYLNPTSSSGQMLAIADSVARAGGRVRMDSFYKNSSVESFQLALRRMRPLSAGFRSIPAALEVFSKPVMENIVPRQKLGIFADIARHELEQLGPNATEAQVREVMSKAWDSVDNRMGQLVYDNLFWKKTLKDTLMATTRSVGWNLGTIRELGGGAADLARLRLTNRSAYLIALPATVALLGAVIQYLYTGKGPDELKDYFYPEMGRKNPDGSIERVQLPSYMKDIFAYTRDPYHTIKHKLHPLLSMTADMLENKDFYGDEIRNPNDPAVKQLEQLAIHAAEQFVPFGIRNAQEEMQRGQPASVIAPNFIGITPAPRNVVRSEAQNLMMELAPKSPSRTPEQKETANTRKLILERSRRGIDVSQDIADAISAGKITPKQSGLTMKLAGVNPLVVQFKRLSLKDAERVYEVATEPEKAILAPVLSEKRKRAGGGSSGLPKPPKAPSAPKR